MSKQKLSPEAQAIVSASDAGLHATVVALVEAFLVDHPQSQRAWLDLGQSLGQLGRYDDAEKAFFRLIELVGDSDSGGVFGEIGNLYRARGDFETALVWYRKQIDADPTDATGLLYLGNVQLRQGNFAAAKSAFEEALNCDLVCLEEAHFSLGLVHRSLGLLADAKREFEKAIELEPKFDEAKTALKDVSMALGNAARSTTD